MVLKKLFSGYNLDKIGLITYEIFKSSEIIGFSNGWHVK